VLTLEPGDILASKYRVERFLASGGMGVLYAATHLMLRQPVAIKFLLAEANARARHRFLCEARAAAALRGEHVCHIYDVGELPSGTPYLVMELLDGVDMSKILKPRRTVPVPVVANLLVQACQGVAEAHAQGVVHRDLKPENLFITRRRDGSFCVKVLDFGISKVPVDVSDRAEPSTTQNAMGTPAYMSPEQLESSRDVDARADIWSLGVVLYELVAGHQPFLGETMIQVGLQVIGGTPPPLRQPGAELPDGFAEVVARCLEKDPAARYGTVEALQFALERYARTDGPDVARWEAQMQETAVMLGRTAAFPLLRGSLLPRRPGSGEPPSARSASPAVAFSIPVPASATGQLFFPSLAPASEPSPLASPVPELSVQRGATAATGRGFPGLGGSSWRTPVGLGALLLVAALLVVIKPAGSGAPRFVASGGAAAAGSHGPVASPAVIAANTGNSAPQEALGDLPQGSPAGAATGGPEPVVVPSHPRAGPRAAVLVTPSPSGSDATPMAAPARSGPRPFAPHGPSLDDKAFSLRR
jgi:eukaryotic-like serine/threonine-protein kinase